MAVSGLMSPPLSPVNTGTHGGASTVGDLQALSCTSASACMAVGGYFSGTDYAGQDKVDYAQEELDNPGPVHGVLVNLSDSAITTDDAFSSPVNRTSVRGSLL